MMRLRTSDTSTYTALALLLAAGQFLAACKGNDAGGTAPPQLPVVEKGDMSLFSVENPISFRWLRLNPTTPGRRSTSPGR